MLSAIIFLPAVAALALTAVPARVPVFVWAWIAVSAADLALVVAAWAGYTTGFGWSENVAWIPGAGVRYHVGVDGLSLPLLAMTAFVFLAVAVYSLRETRRVKSYVCLFLFL